MPSRNPTPTPSERPRCAGVTDDRPCRAWPVPGSTLCRSHLGPTNKSSMTPEVVDHIVALVEIGNYLKVAVATAGVASSTFDGWYKRGDPAGTDERDAEFREMRARIAVAYSTGESRLIEVIRDAAVESWQAAAWLLERSRTERWARPSQRVVEDAPPPSPVVGPADPFAEVDDLALRRAA